MTDAWADLDDDLNLDDVEALEGGFATFPAGVYPAVVTAFDRWDNFETAEPGKERRACRFHYEVTDGQFKGQTYQHWFSVPMGSKDDPAVQEALGFVKGNFEKIGVVSGFTNEDVVGIDVVFTLTEIAGKGKHAGKTFVNLTSIAARRSEVSAPQGTAAPKAAAAVADEDDPFAD